MPKDSYGGWSLRNLLLAFLALSLSAALLIIVVFSTLYQKALRDNREDAIELYTAEQTSILESNLENIRMALYSLANKEEIRDYLAGTEGYRVTVNGYITSLLSGITQYVPGITNLLLTQQGNRTVAYAQSGVNIENFRVQMDITERYWQNDAGTFQNYTLQPKNSKGYILAVCVPVGKNGQGAAVAFCTVSDIGFNMRMLEGPYSIWKEGKEIYRGGGSASAQSGDGLRVRLESLGWEIWGVYPIRANGAPLEAQLFTWLVLSVLVLGGLEVLTMLAIHKTIVKPIVHISGQSASVNSTHTLLKNPARGRNELNILVNNLNDMVTRIGDLSSEVRDARVRLMRMDILRLREKNMFLQAQINPHFLYNMLECICGMAARDGNREIRETAQLLSSMYRYCLRSPHSTLGEELECLELYQRILRLRFSERYTIETNVPEELYMYPVPRMILEPIVENSVQHGFVRGKEEQFQVTISAQLDGEDLEVVISDNGCGMEEEMIEAFNQRLASVEMDLSEGKWIGICNVGFRLRLSNGDNSALTLAKNSKGGLDVRMRILCMTNVKEI